MERSFKAEMVHTGFMGLDAGRYTEEEDSQIKKLGVITHACNPTLGKLRQKDWEFNTSLVYTEEITSLSKEREPRREKRTFNIINQLLIKS